MSPDHFLVRRLRLTRSFFLRQRQRKNPPFLSEVERRCSLNRPMSGVRALCLIAETDHLSPVRVFSPVRAQSFFQMSRGFVERAQTTVLVLGPGIRLPITVISLCQSRGSGYPLCLMSCFHSAVIQANTLYSANTLSKVSTRELESHLGPGEYPYRHLSCSLKAAGGGIIYLKRG